MLGCKITWEAEVNAKSFEEAAQLAKQVVEEVEKAKNGLSGNVLTNIQIVSRKEGFR